VCVPVSLDVAVAVAEVRCRRLPVYRNRRHPWLDQPPVATGRLVAVVDEDGFRRIDLETRGEAEVVDEVERLRPLAEPEDEVEDVGNPVAQTILPRTPTRRRYSIPCA
jgi:hypothetical protein